MNENETILESYRRRINLMIVYICQHLDENPNLETLASAAGFSPYHFHRIAKAFLGETIGNFIVRKRVETAARLLKDTDLTVCEIAYKVGYDVPSSLSKAFKLFYGISPNDFRNNKNNLIMKEVKINPALQLEERIEVLNPKKAISYSLQGKDYLTLDYNGAWKVLMAYAGKMKINPAKAEYISIYYDDPCDELSATMHADVCLVTDRPLEPSENLQVKEIAGGRYAIYRYKGTYQQLGSVYDTIFGKYIPEGGYKPDARPLFEKYLNDPATTKPENLLTEIYVPIE